MNSSFGQLSLVKTLVSNNKGDGIHMVQGNVDHDLLNNINELCSLPTTTSQTFPVLVSVQQNGYNAKQINCYKVLKLKDLFNRKLYLLINLLLISEFIYKNWTSVNCKY